MQDKRRLKKNPPPKKKKQGLRARAFCGCISVGRGGGSTEDKRPTRQKTNKTEDQQDKRPTTQKTKQHKRPTTQKTNKTKDQQD